jgi:hypothetical protein
LALTCSFRKRQAPRGVGLVVTVAVLASIALKTPVAKAEAHSIIQIETVSNYASYSTCCNSQGMCDQLGDSNASGINFASELLDYSNPAGFGDTPYSYFQDTDVWDLDFQDPNIAGANAQFDDTYAFDQPGNAISFFQGHGAYYQPNAFCCKQASDCPAQGPGSLSKACVGTPVNNSSSCAAGSLAYKGNCMYQNRYKVPAFVTCGSNDTSARAALLNSPGAQFVAFGENPTVGAWRGAATNGGISLAIVRHSMGMALPFASDWWPVFAGLHLYAGVAMAADINGFNDEVDSASYGWAVAMPYVMAPTSSIKSGYINAISNVPEGGGCPSGFPGGFQGCGCHAIMTMSATNAGAQATINEDWYALTSDNSAQTGTSYWYWYIGCNYNPNNSWSGGP